MSVSQKLKSQSSKGATSGLTRPVCCHGPHYITLASAALHVADGILSGILYGQDSGEITVRHSRGST